MRRGFTLIELSYVIAVIALLAAITVPAYDVLLRRAHVAEARAVVHGIAHAELRHLRDRGHYLPCGPAGDVPTEPVAFPADAPCWKALGIRTEGLVRYRYAVSVADGSFLVSAEGDLDGDGIVSRFSLSGHDLELVVVDELE